MKKNNYKIDIDCSMYINANVYIGEDNIGHICYNKAKYTDGIYYYCEKCYKDVLSGNIEHITFPTMNCVQALRSIINSTKNKNRE